MIVQWFGARSRLWREGDTVQIQQLSVDKRRPDFPRQKGSWSWDKAPQSFKDALDGVLHT